jgi:secreted trypsin-like serine protease
MTTSRLIRAPLRATLVAALVAAMVVLFVFVQSSQAAPAADEGPTAAKSSYQVVGGKPVPDGKYPFMAYIEVRLTPKTASTCGGSLIDKTHVLTAGHCVFKGNAAGFSATPQNTLLAIGRTVFNSNQGQLRHVKAIDVHPAYKGETIANQRGEFRYDVAVITLSRPVSGIEPIELASPRQNYLENPGRVATTAGWGSTAQRAICDPKGEPRYPNRMQEAQVPIISDSSADKVVDAPAACGYRQGKSFHPQLMIAAGNTDVSACQGDSGGPLFLKTSGNGNDENGEEYTQIGIVSFTEGCATGVPAVYTEVNPEPIATFIERTVDGDHENGDHENGDD